MPDTDHAYRGSCHCGRVAFEFASKPITHVHDCNCSVCHKMGTLWHGLADAALRITQGEEELTLYQFGTRTARHYFCRHCGIHAFSRPRVDPANWVVNVRCVDGVDVAALKVIAFDGQNWEQSARALHARRAAAG